jgi:hypothetical protein
MQLTPEQFAARFPHRASPVPAEYLGQWVAWNVDRTRIVAHGIELRETRDRAVEAGCARPLLQKIPRGPFVGGA